MNTGKFNRVNFEINKLTPDKTSVVFLKKIAENTVKIIKLKGFNEISIAIVCNTRMKNLNRKYRGKNETTDVLAFDYGEIFICLPQAKRQAKKIKHSLKKELAILLIHGILHLAGYNDRTKSGYNKMVKLQEDLCQRTI
ncbi:MAG: rRNA maturation RNase YbeY [Candidatus Portnoybacteria bacterium RBG_13_40_8]|uniref:Endoribonuclease YbeY n=1 Tax=Candidatus Portnoybacteria bacterium RBG_13_40_8 TaxID=1801990 RepID=A0A1G2F689_9BACT|nr:MAG: rRNA maturation RNase YbeY [Candidatus Portnoybacteria bacterium RBG_13_40_8]